MNNLFYCTIFIIGGVYLVKKIFNIENQSLEKAFHNLIIKSTNPELTGMLLNTKAEIFAYNSGIDYFIKEIKKIINDNNIKKCVQIVELNALIKSHGKSLYNNASDIKIEVNKLILYLQDSQVKEFDYSILREKLTIYLIWLQEIEYSFFNINKNNVENKQILKYVNELEKQLANFLK